MNINNLCRVCLKTTMQMVTFSPKNDETADLIAMLSLVGKIEIEIKDQFPSFLCEICLKSLQECYRFQMLIQKTNNFLKKYSFEKNEHYAEDFKSHPTVENFQCDSCDSTFPSEDCLRKHCLIHNKKETCQKRVRSHHPQRRDAKLCILCGKSFSTQYRFRIHMRTHTGETPYKCQYCDHRMTSRNYLVAHERTHTGEKPYKCTTCNKCFSQSSVLRTHLKLHQPRTIGCALCTKRFCREIDLKMHMRRHTGEKPYSCDVCNQTFMQQSHLSEHLVRHSDDRPYKCAQCSKAFKQLSTFKGHLKIHTGDKPFKCNQCSFATRQRHSLRVHMKQHPL